MGLNGVGGVVTVSDAEHAQDGVALDHLVAVLLPDGHGVRGEETLCLLFAELLEAVAAVLILCTSVAEQSAD